MTLYRIRFELNSSLITPLKGDTIWGHIVWGIANHEGNKEVENFLEQEKSGSPALIVSSAFPAGMVCRPLPLPKEREGNLSKEAYSKIKIDKKKKYVPASKYLEFDTHDKIDEKQTGEDQMKNVEIMHNRIDRITNTVLKTGLYSTEEKWSKASKWDIYILSSLDSDRIKQLVEWAFENGYGADASIGKGKITNIEKPEKVKTTIKNNTYMALGPFVGSDSIENLRADIFVRFGKLGGAFASGLSPHKKPVVLYDEGAVFECDTSIEYTGRLLEKMHGTEEFNICQSGFAPVIPVVIDEELP